MFTIYEEFQRLKTEIESLRNIIVNIKPSISFASPADKETAGDRYIIDISEEVRRVLITQKGSIPMNPEYGSELYKLRDRTLSDEVRLNIISFTFDAIDRWVDRVKCKKVDVIPINNREYDLRIEVDFIYA